MNGSTLPKISVIIIALFNLSFQWPVESPKVTSIFGESRGDHFHDGVDMVSPVNRIFPVEEGDLVYFWDRSIFPLENYPGGGNYRVLKHRDSIYSIYLHLDDSPSHKEVYTVRDVVGTIGDTGRSYGRHLHLSMLNYSNRMSVNPLTMLPGCNDGVAPLVADAYVRIGDRYSVIKDKANIRLTRQYPLLIDITDSMGGRERLGIFSLAVESNGRPLMEINFTAIEYSKNGLTISGKPFQDLFDEKGYYKISNISYNDGINTLKITARDFHGNETVKELTFNVKLDMRRESGI